MNKINDTLIEEVQQYVTELLEKNLSDTIKFHNADHSRYVADAVETIGKGNGLSDEEINLAKIAAWFHDTGYIAASENHEQEGVNLATSFLKSKGVDNASIDRITQAILSTHMPQSPKDIISEVLCDADLMHLTEDDYFDRVEKMRQEWSAFTGAKIGKLKFHKKSVNFFQKHNYHTRFARETLDPRKQKNFELLQKEVFMLEEKKEKKILENSTKKGKGYSRGVESMFRLTARNQISLSSIADNKSNILITVNALMMSISMTVLVTRFEELPNIILPTMIFLVVSLVTIVLAILSTRPNISSGKFSKEDIQQNKVNLLFFGNFYNMKLNEYEWAIGELMKNDENLYGTMIKDQYFLGKVLAKKYKLLRVAYTVFMFGIVISVVAFVLAFTNL